MAAKNTVDSKRFVIHSPNKDPESLYVPINEPEPSFVSRRSQQPPPITNVPSNDSPTSNTDSAHPARRVVVIRNTKNPQSAKGRVDLGELGKSNADNAPVISDGNKSVYVIRRPIGSDSTKPVEVHQKVHEPVRTPSPASNPRRSPPIRLKSSKRSLSPTQTENAQNYVPYLRKSRSKVRRPSPQLSPPPVRPYSLKRSLSPSQTENTQPYVPYLRRSRSKVRTPSPQRVPSGHPINRSISPTQAEDSQQYAPYLRRSKSKTRIESTRRPKSSRPPPIDVEESDNIEPLQSLPTFYSIQSAEEAMNASNPVTIENEIHSSESHRRPRAKNTQHRVTSSTGTKSPKSIVLIHPEDQSIAVIENSHVKGDTLRFVAKRPKSVKVTRFLDTNEDRSTENLVETSRRKRCLACLSRHMCLIIIICIILIIIGLAGVGVSAYFYTTDSKDYFIPIVVGIAVGGALALAAFLFLCILLACIGSRDGYFSYHGEEPRVGGRAFALIPPTHPNAYLYIPRDYMKLVENGYRLPVTQSSASQPVGVMYGHPTLSAPLTANPNISQQSQAYTSNSTKVVVNTKTNNKEQITIEMPERLVTGQKMSAQTRERSLNKIVKNIGQAVEDAKKRYNGEPPKKVIVHIDENAKETK